MKIAGTLILPQMILGKLSKGLPSESDPMSSKVGFCVFACSMFLMQTRIAH